MEQKRGASPRAIKVVDDRFAPCDEHGGRAGPYERRFFLTVPVSVRLHREEPGEGRHLLRRLGELEGKTLGCWCAAKGGVTEHDSLVCHGQTLLLLLAHRRKKTEEKVRGQSSR